MSLRRGPFRLAQRQDGEWVYVYKAPIDSQEGWVELIKIRTAVLDSIPQGQWYEVLRAITVAMAHELGHQPSVVLVERPPEQ